jgi:hypothetical protein
VNLADFFAQPDDWIRKFDLKRPFEQEDFTYATDARICLRVRPQAGDLLDTGGLKLPPAAGLRWDHEQLTGWRPWKLDRLEIADGICFKCDGKGWIGNIVVCQTCDGEGCAQCFNSGNLGDATCPRCEAKMFRKEPWHAFVGPYKIDVRYFRKILRLGDVEYAEGPPVRAPHYPGLKDNGPYTPIRFRFAEGAGLLCTLAK